MIDDRDSLGCDDGSNILRLQSNILNICRAVAGEVFGSEDTLKLATTRYQWKVDLLGYLNLKGRCTIVGSGDGRRRKRVFAGDRNIGWQARRIEYGWCRVRKINGKTKLFSMPLIIFSFIGNGNGGAAGNLTSLKIAVADRL